MPSYCKTRGVIPKRRKPGTKRSIVCQVMDATALANVRWDGAMWRMSEKMGRLGNAEIDFRTGFRTISGRPRPTRRGRKETARFPSGPLSPSALRLT